MRAVVRATRTFFSLALPYFRSEDRWIAGALLTGILVVELGLVAILVAINEWNKRFFNALESRDWSAAQFELIVFCVIALSAVVAGMLQFFFGQRLIIRWRRWITERYVSMWMANGRHYRRAAGRFQRRQHPPAHRQRRADLPARARTSCSPR